jgi:hypothetical protein
LSRSSASPPTSAPAVRRSKRSSATPASARAGSSERTHSWLNRFRGLLIRGFEETSDHRALLQVNDDIGRRTDVVGIFAEDRSLIRSATGLVIE